MTWGWYRMFVCSFGEKQLLNQLHSLSCRQRLMGNRQWGQVEVDFKTSCHDPQGQSVLPGLVLRPAPWTLYLLSYCQVRPTALKKHPIITCDKSSSYLEDQAGNTQGRQMATSRWLMHVREQRIEQTLLSQAHGCPLAWVTWQKINHFYTKTTWK